MKAMKSACRGSLLHRPRAQAERNQLSESDNTVLPARERDYLPVQLGLAEKAHL